jgi:hypothetical protein
VDTSDPCSNNNCDQNAACTNTPGGFTCACNPGYTEGDGGTCVDIDGCDGIDCGTGEICTDVTAPGTGYSCSCNPGFTRDGETCADIDECASGTHNCDQNAACANTPGGFTCACNPGYAGNGETCTDIDECASGTHNCDQNAACTNTPGGFTCACNPGFTGDDGTDCIDIDGCDGITCKEHGNISGKCIDQPGPHTGYSCACHYAHATYPTTNRPCHDPATLPGAGSGGIVGSGLGNALYECTNPLPSERWVQNRVPSESVQACVDRVMSEAGVTEADRAIHGD